MKYVMVPNDVKLTNPATGERIQMEKGDMDPVTMSRFVLDNICNDEKIGKGGDGMRRIIRLEKAFEGKRPGSVVDVESDDHKVMITICNEMTFKVPLIGKQFYPFVEAIEKATDEKPAEKTNGLALGDVPLIHESANA